VSQKKNCRLINLLHVEESCTDIHVVVYVRYTLIVLASKSMHHFHLTLYLLSVLCNLSGE